VRVEGKLSGWGNTTKGARVENREEKNKCRENGRERKYRAEIDVKTERNWKGNEVHLLKYRRLKTACTFPDYWILAKQPNGKRTDTLTRLQVRNKTTLAKWLHMAMLHSQNITIFFFKLQQ
jgi:hypothetical protein